MHLPEEKRQTLMEYEPRKHGPRYCRSLIPAVNDANARWTRSRFIPIVRVVLCRRRRRPKA